MSTCLVARSISRPVRERLQQPFQAQVMAVFAHACHLATSDGEVIALVTPRIGDGPLNVVAEQVRRQLPAEAQGRQLAMDGLFEEGTSARLAGQHLRVGRLAVDLTGAAAWEPRPHWDALRARQTIILDRVPLLHRIAVAYAPRESLLARAFFHPTADYDRHEGEPWDSRIVRTVREAAATLEAGWEGNRALLEGGAVQLAGLGSGLTPAGDDFLCGAMLWAWLTHPAPRMHCQTLVAAAAPRTTALSAALLRAAGRGECGAPWHGLLAALEAGDERAIATAVQGVLAHGATSGADALAGFLWIGTDHTPPSSFSPNAL